MESTACRICGRDDWASNKFSERVTFRAIHEAAHVRAGIARYTSPKVRGEVRGIEAITKPNNLLDKLTLNTPDGQHAEPTQPTPVANHPNLVPGQKIGACVITDDLKLRDKAGRKHELYDGRPCEVCGKTDGFVTQSQWFGHRNWHIRRGEADWSHGPKGSRTLIPVKKKKNLPVHVKNQPLVAEFQDEQNTQMQQDISPALALDVPHECDAVQAVGDVQRSLTFLNLALALQRMSPEQAAQLVGTINTLGAHSGDRKRR